jgi:hypothetical protein
MVPFRGYRRFGETAFACQRLACVGRRAGWQVGRERRLIHLHVELESRLAAAFEDRLRIGSRRRPRDHERHRRHSASDDHLALTA